MSALDVLDEASADDRLSAEIQPETLFSPREYGWGIFRLFCLVGGILGVAYVLRQPFVAWDVQVAIAVLVVAVSGLCAFLAWSGAHEVVRHHTWISMIGDELIVIRQARTPIKGSWSDWLLRPRGTDTRPLGFQELEVRVPLAECRYFLGFSSLDPQFCQFRRRQCLLVVWPPYGDQERVAVAFGEDEIKQWLDRLEPSPGVRISDRFRWDREWIAVGAVGGAVTAIVTLIFAGKVCGVLFGFGPLGIREAVDPITLLIGAFWGGQCGRLITKSVLGFGISRPDFRDSLCRLMAFSWYMIVSSILGNARPPGTLWPAVSLFVVTLCGLVGAYGVYWWAKRREDAMGSVRENGDSQCG